MHALRNDRIGLQFNEAGALTRIESADEAVRIPLDADGVTPTWEVQLRDAGGDIVHVTPEQEPNASLSRSEDQQVLILEWQASGDWGELDVTVTVRLPDHSELSYWSLSITNKTERAIFQATFPRVSGLLDYEEGAPGWLAMPVIMGDKTPQPVAFVNQHQPMIENWARRQYGAFDAEGGPADIAYAYPGFLTMQFLAYGQPQTGGLYFGAYDSQALYKCFGMYADGDAGKHSVIQMKQYPEDRTVIGADFQSFYECPVGIYRGEWWNASAIYREWALDQFWAAKGPVKDRDGVPDWVKNNDIWYWNWQFKRTGHPETVVPIIKAIKKKYDCGIAFHWYGSNGEVRPSRFRTPEIYPHCPDIRRQIAAATEELHDAGIHCIPYLETRNVRPELGTFQEHDGMNWIARNEHGEAADRWLGGYTMCPTAPFFHDLIRTQVEKMMDDCGMDGAYLDQLSGCYPVPCFDPDHPHPPGGHDHWVRGYRELATKVRKSMRSRKPDSVITSEGVTECFLDLLDLDLARDIADLSGRVGSERTHPIPMFHSVYHDYHITYGTISTFRPKAGDPPVIMEHFCYAEALTLIGGGQLMISGAFPGDDTKEEFAPFFDYMETLTGARKSAREHFNMGRWLPPLRIECDTVDLKFNADRPPKRNLPTVISGCFEYNGSIVAALVNHTDTMRSVRIDLSPKWFSRRDDWERISLVFPEEKQLDGSRDASLEMDLPSHSAYLIKME